MPLISQQLVSVFEKNDFADIFGQKKAKLQLKSALLAGHHVILIGPPGVGKTTLAKNIARMLPAIEVNDCPWNCDPEQPQCPQCAHAAGKIKKKNILGEERFVRVQGSPDLTTEDLLGDIDPIKALEFGPLSVVAFTPGKVFRANQGVLFFDELNRAPEKLQNALLQVLEEGKATIGNYTVDFHATFLFIGTMNPKDASTEKLSDVLLDRFDVVSVGYPENEQVERQIVLGKGKKIVQFPEQLLGLMVRFVRCLRQDKELEKVPSVRACISLYERSQTMALLCGRDKVTLADIKEAVVSVLAHRVELKPSLRYVHSAEEVVASRFADFVQEQGKDIPHEGGEGL